MEGKGRRSVGGRGGRWLRPSGGRRAESMGEEEEKGRRGRRRGGREGGSSGELRIGTGRGESEEAAVRRKGRPRDRFPLGEISALPFFLLPTFPELTPTHFGGPPQKEASNATKSSQFFEMRICVVKIEANRRQGGRMGPFRFTNGGKCAANASRNVREEARLSPHGKLKTRIFHHASSHKQIHELPTKHGARPATSRRRLGRVSGEIGLRRRRTREAKSAHGQKNKTISGNLDL